MKFKLKDAEKFGWDGLSGFAYNSNEDFKNASAAYFEVNGKHGKIINKKCDRVYLVLEGTREFIINDEPINVEKMDIVIVPKNTPYDYLGKMKLFLVDSPAYDGNFEKKLE